MSRSFLIPEPIAQYLDKTFLREPDVLKRLRDETAAMPNAGMQIGPDQGAFMAFLIHLTGAKRYLEVGVFTGYSSTVVALALPDHGQVVACDVSEEFTATARRYWKEAGVDHKVDLRIAPALQTLDTLVRQEERFDLCFIDADKTNYLAYYESAVGLVRPGGLILIDNVLWSGAVADPSNQEADTEAIRQVNERVATDQRVDAVLLPIGDGLTLARVK